MCIRDREYSVLFAGERHDGRGGFSAPTEERKAMAIELTPTPEAVLVEGAVGCGKTTRLVERAAALLEGGAAPVSYTHLDVYKRQVLH